MDKLDKNKLLKFLKSLSINVKNINNFITAFSHSSYVNEHKDDPLFETSYDRLEFLGDSVLGLITSNYLYQNKQIFSAGDMSFYRSKVIRKEFLFKIHPTNALFMLGSSDFKVKNKTN